MDAFNYRLTQRKKENIAHNLIAALESDVNIEKDTVTFICNWMLTGPNEKRKAFFDVWDIVLRNYMPKTRPILFRSCLRRKDDRIASFTGRLEAARRFNGGKGFLIMCDTKEDLHFEEKHYKRGEYRHTFYPLVDLLKRDDESESHVFSDSLRRDYIGEDEYIMRVNLGNMHSFKWHQEREVTTT
jgi:hypothetical protein